MDVNRPVKKKKNWAIYVIALSILLITYLHYSTLPGIRELHDIFREFYYVPIFFGALWFGLKGSVITFLCILVIYLPYIFLNWPGDFVGELNMLLHLFLQGLFGFFAGFILDRDRRQRAQLEKERYLAGIGQVAATIMHDLKNPLITIQGYARRIKEGKRSDAAVQAITECADDMDRIVHYVLDFAKPLRLELKEEDMGEVVRESYVSCKTKAEQKDVVLSLDLPSGPVKLVVDAFQIKRALVNIINNSIEASGEGQKVNISMFPEKSRLVIKVMDQGPGMSRDTLENIFIPFYSKKKEGTGLGLPIAKKIIDGHRGKINIKSEPGKGTEVIIGLPFRKPA